MAVFEFSVFFGKRPGLEPSKLRSQDAVQATNVDLRRGVLEPLKGSSVIQAGQFSTNPRAIYRYTNGLWFERPNPTDFVTSPVRNDPWDRVYYVEQGQAPQFTANDIATGGAGPYPSASYQLGVPAPATAPLASLGGTPNNPNDPAETRFYVVTYVDAYGHEGPPSAPSNSVDWRPGNTVSLTLPGPPTGSYNITTQRVYRSNGTGAGAVWQFVADFAAAAGAYTDPEAGLGEVLPSAEWDPPPADLEHMTAHPAGFLVGARKNELLFSEPGAPHAWPVRYRYPLLHNVVGLGVIGGTVVVMTDAQPVIVTGQHPAAMSITYTQVRQGCVAKEGIVNTAGSVLYPSPDGLVEVTPSGARLVTQALHTRETWQALNPQNIRAFYWEGLYLAFVVDPITGTGQTGFVFNPAQPDAGIVEVGAIDVGAGYYDPVADLQYVAIGNDLHTWGTGANLTPFYQSSPRWLAKPAAPQVVQVDLVPGSPSAVIGVYGDGSLLGSVVVPSDRPVRLNRITGRYRSWSVSLMNAAQVRRIVLASSMSELQRV